MNQEARIWTLVISTAIGLGTVVTFTTPSAEASAYDHCPTDNDPGVFWVACVATCPVFAEALLKCYPIPTRP